MTILSPAIAFADTDNNPDIIARITESANQSEWKAIGASMFRDRGTTWELGEKLSEAGVPEITASAGRKTPGAVKYGTLISKDVNRNGKIESNVMRIYNSAGNDSIDGIFSSDCRVLVRIDAAAGTVVIPAQQVFTHQLYGPIYICPVTISGTGMTYSKTGNINGTIDADGNISIGAWGAFVVEGSSAGGSFGIYTSSRFMPANAKVSITMSDNKVVDAPGYIEQTADNELLLYNFAGVGSPVSARISSSRQIKVNPQFIANYGQYGDFYVYAADLANNKVNLSTALVGSGDDRSLKFGNWVVGTNHNCAQVAIKALSSTMTIESGSIKYPAQSSSFGGEGTKASPYQIKTAADLVRVSQNVDGGERYAGKYFRLENDIDFSGSSAAFYPIGDMVTPFEGEFDGNNHTIKNLHINGQGAGNAGLFGYTGEKSVVRNLDMTGVVVTGSGHYIGGVAGTNYGLIDNCHVNGSFSGETLFMGGITGAAWGYVTNCTFKGTITTKAIAGGIAGTSFSHVENCHADAAMVVTGALDSYYHDVAGISGVATRGKDLEGLITGCSFAGTLSDTGGYGYVAGIVSKAMNMKIEKCFNVGAISAVRKNMETDTYTGGIVAWCNKSDLKDCFNAGTIVKSGLASDGVGGIVAYISIGYNITGTPFVTDKSFFENCYNSGQVTSSNSWGRKGIYGSIYVREGFPTDPTDGFFTNCYNDYQATGLRDDRFNIGVAEFTSGNLPKGFDSSVWTAKAGSYPLLKASASLDCASLASAALILQDKETVVKVKKNMTLSSEPNIEWALYDNGYKQETKGLKINGKNLELKDTYSNEVLAARLDEGHIKIYRISVIPNLFEGEGTADVPYLIRNEHDFIGLHKAISQYGQSHEGDFFRMTQDIDLNYSDNFSGVGLGSNTEFKGTFDGDGHSVKRMKIHSAAMNAQGVAQSSGSKSYAGLFSRIGAEGTVKNVNIASDCDFIFYNNSGAIAGSVKGTVTGCRNYAEVKGVDDYMGGIAGTLEVGGTISSCYNSGKVIAGGNGAGGIVGRAWASKAGGCVVEFCQNDGPVSADYYNDFRINRIHSEAGGIVANNFGTIRNCLNQGHVRALHTVGGIAGKNSSNYGFGDVISCVNSGTINAVNENENRGAITGTAALSGIRSNCYYDCTTITYGAAQNASAHGVTALTTSSLTSGNTLEGLSTDVWSFEKDKYPVLKAFENEAASASMRSIYLGLGESTRLEVPAETMLKSTAGTQWSLRLGKHFSIAGQTLKSVLPADSIMVADTLTAAAGNVFKEYALQSVKVVFAGSGTEKDPYQIKNRVDLDNLAVVIDKTGIDYANRYFKVLNDIDCGKENLSPIACGINKFQGIFDGNGKNITYNLEDTDAKTGKDIGLFSVAGENAVIKDLILTPVLKGNSGVGAFVGKLYGRLENCVNRGSVEATGTSAYLAGLAGKMFSGGSIDKCRNEGTVNGAGNYVSGIVSSVERKATVSDCENKGAVTSTKNYVAGIAAKSGGLITRSINRGELKGVSYMAGIVAMLDSAGSVEYCENIVEINTPTGSQGAGIVTGLGTENHGHVKGCINRGNVTAKTYAAGIISRARHGIGVDSCFNYADIKSIGSYAGGVIGDIDGSSTFKSTASNCVNYGSVQGGEQYTGGFAGRISSYTEVSDCYSLGNVKTVKGGTAKTYIAGGFAGFAAGEVNRCWSAGNVDAEGYSTGGFIGYSNAAKISNCFSLGDVKSQGVARVDNYANAGGFLGVASNTTINNVYCSGTVEAPGYAAGLIGASYSSVKVYNAYTVSKIKVSDNTKVGAVSEYAGTTGTPANTVFDNVYYLTASAGTLSSLDSRCKGVDEPALIQADLGNAFHISRGSFPVIADILEPALAHYAAATYEFWNPADKVSALTDNLYVGNHGMEQWSSSEHFVIKDGIAFPVKLGEGTITLTSPDGISKREFRFNITKVSGVDSIGTAREIVSRSYIDMQGCAVASPEKGKVYVVRTQYDDGSFTIEKQIYMD